MSTFTAADMDMTLHKLMMTLDSAGWDNYLNIIENLEYIPSEDLTQMITEWPPKIHLLMNVNLFISVMF